MKTPVLKPLAVALIAVLAAPAFAAAASQLPAPEKIVLKNGLTVYYLRNSDLPVVSFRMFVRGAGTAFAPAGEEGVAGLTAALMTKGTAKMDAEAIAEALDFMGASFSVSAADEYAQVSGDSLTQHFPRLMEIAAGCLTGPSFKDEEFAKERARQVDSLKSLKDNPGAAVRSYFRKAYFDGHPLGRVASEPSLAKITLQAVREFYARRFRPDRAIAAVVGDIERERLVELLEATLGPWANPAGAAASEAIPPLPRPKGKTLVLIDKPDATQAYFVMGAPGYAMGDKVTPQATVMNTLWGGRFTSWLNTELRIKRGLTYGASSLFWTWAPGGVFQASSYTKNDKIGEALDLTFGLLAKGGREGFSAEEVESGRNYILGQFPPTLETNASKAGAYVRLAFYRVGFDYYDKYLAAIAKVSPAEAKAAAAALLPQNDYVLVVVGRAADVLPQLKKYGTWQEKKITDAGF
ncbi:MAG TPA: pitrilysin family protein [Terriglobales bacterium]|nr:pitrilysin family protein [Terriglobales bacterium]